MPTHKSNGASWVVDALGSQISRSRQLVCIECTKPSLLPATNLDFGAPPVASFYDALRGVPIHGVFRSGYVSEIANPIIVSDAIDVVDLPIWKCPVNIKPSKPVSSVEMPKDGNSDVPLTITVSNGLAASSVISTAFKHASFWIIVKSIFDGVLGKLAGVFLNSDSWWPRLPTFLDVRYSIVRFVPVNMGNGFLGPLSKNIEPCKSMGEMQSVINPNKNVAIVSFAASNIASLLICRRFFPDENTSFWVVVKHFAQACCGKIGLSHDTVPSLIGQRLARVDSTGGLRHFTTLACSGVLGITKHIHKAKTSLAGFSTQFFLNPFGASSPFNAL